MIIQCDQCERKFRVDDSKIKPPGSRVRCSKCGNVFFVEKKEKLNADDNRADKATDLRMDTQSSAGSQNDSFNIDVSPVEQKEQSSPEPQQTAEQDLSEHKRKDFVWTVNDMEAEVMAESNEASSVTLDSKERQEDIKAKISEIPDSQDEQVVTPSESKSSFDWNSAQVEQQPPQEISSETESVSAPEYTTNTEQIPFYSPSGNTGEVQHNIDVRSGITDSSTMSAEQKDSSEFDTPTFDDKDLKLDINKAASTDQTPTKMDEPPADPFKSSLSVDQSTLSQIKAESFGTASPEYNDFSTEPAVIKSRYVPKSKGIGSRIVSLAVSLIVGLSILVIITSVFLILSINFNILPKEKTRQLRQFLVTHLPVRVNDPISDIKIVDVKGKWLSTLNGPVFVLSGNITNDSDNIVNYIKIKSEFINDGELLFDKSIYAGNTFTDQELQSLPLNDILVKLNRKNGDIDFSDPRKLAGKNYNIMPGESVEFYSVFPSDNQILGLKYNLKIVDAEVVEIDQSS